MTSLVIFAKDPNVQFRPNLCPYCTHFVAGNRKCEAFEMTYAMGDKGPAPLYNSTFEHCEKFQRRAGGNVHFFEGLTVDEAITAAKQHFQVADIGEPVVIRKRQDWNVSSLGMTEEEAVGNAKRLLPVDAIEVGTPTVSPRNPSSAELVATISFQLKCVILVTYARPWWKFW